MIEKVLKAREEIKKALKRNRELATQVVGGYEKEEDQWDIYDSSLESFALVFERSLPEDYRKNLEKRKPLEYLFNGELLQIYIEETLANNAEKHDLTAIEFADLDPTFCRVYPQVF